MKRNIYIDFGYLVLLAASFGAVLTLGAIVAPVVFQTDKLGMDILIDRYNAGIIMGTIFEHFSYWLYVVMIYVAAYEVSLYKWGQRDRISILSALMVIFTSAMFNGVYIPKILALQDMGREATKSDTFNNLHTASEWDFKILAIALLVLFIRRLMLLKRG
jgi:hypothetical protein